MRYFTTGELTRLQGVQDGHMQDTCIISVYSSTPDDWNNPDPTYTAGSAIACGVEQVSPDEVQQSGQVPEIDATIRLPIGTTITPEDTVTITHRYGVALSPNEIYNVIGPVRRGPSGVRAGCKKRIDAS